MIFTFWGREFEYADFAYNTTRQNERAVELPIAFDFVDHAEGRGLEVGNVLSHYRPVAHRVVDRYEPADGFDARAWDVFDIDGMYDWIVSVSTLEHVRNDKRELRNPAGGVAALIYLSGLLTPNGHMLVTVGLGQNPLLDRMLLEDEPAERAATLVREGDGWVQTDELTFEPYLSNPCRAASVWIGEW